MPARPSFPIVGIGASAGGLAAFEAFFAGMPADCDTGMAFVLVQHLAPDHKSILTDLVKRYTRMDVFEVEDGMEVKPNCAYIIPPNRDMAFLNGTLHLFEPAAPRGLRLPIDFFFRSLAQDQHERAICIILSGTGSDGTLGMRAIKGQGGLTIVQEPASTGYDGMPRSALATGLVDYVLEPAEMAPRLIAYAAHAFEKRPFPPAQPSSEPESTLHKVCVLIRAETGHDFSGYKEKTIVRRIGRRMAMHEIERSGDYLRFLRQNPSEVEALFRDLLIGVTNFFRDPDAFEALELQLQEHVFNRVPAAEWLRIWVAGCSTGEEAYSLAILVQEHAERARQPLRVQIFATDIDRLAIVQARAGVYPASIAADVSDERLTRYFVKDSAGDTYRISKAIRDLVIFSEQDVIKDPPFSKLDLISCRNLMIYMNAELQRKLIPLFHYALKPGGLLFLGTAETVGEHASSFAALDRKSKVFLRRLRLAGSAGSAVPSLATSFSRTTAAHRTVRDSGAAAPRTGLREVTEQALLRHYARTGILVSAQGDILHIYGRTGRYLEPAPGDAGMNILAMARSGLSRELATALHRSAACREPVRRRGLTVQTEADDITVDLSVAPVTRDAEGLPDPELYLVIIEELPATKPALGSPDHEGSDAEQALVAPLERELRAKEEYLQTTLEEMETAAEELKSSNEEMQSINEELQSTNEELETSKEELQSVNEELATVNTELQTKVNDLSRANDDMNNLLAGTGVGTLFVDHGLRIARFTPPATHVINLIQTDLGRPIGHITHNLENYADLESDLRSVLDTLVPIEKEVRTNRAAWCLMHIRPYRTLDNVIEGAVITFVDITARKATEASLADARVLAESIVASVREPLLVLDDELRVVTANPAFYTNFAVTKLETIGQPFYELGNRQWDIDELRRRLHHILEHGGSFDDFELHHDFERIGPRRVLLNARRVRAGPESEVRILLAIEDTSNRPISPQGSAKASLPASREETET